MQYLISLGVFGRQDKSQLKEEVELIFEEIAEDTVSSSSYVTYINGVIMGILSTNDNVMLNKEDIAELTKEKFYGQLKRIKERLSFFDFDFKNLMVRLCTVVPKLSILSADFTKDTIALSFVTAIQDIVNATLVIFESYRYDYKDIIHGIDIDSEVYTDMQKSYIDVLLVCNSIRVDTDYTISRPLLDSVKEDKDD